MKLQNLSIIFILIIMPIVIVFTEYIDNQIETIQTESIYDSRLLNATYDAIKAYQLNTINNANSDRPVSKIDDIEAAVTTFYNSLVTSFRYDGYDSSVMDEYVPAVVFTMYDGYYIYQPFYNTLTQMSDDAVDDDYSDGSLLNGLKPYVYYNCRYSNSDVDVVITYTLDNFITIEGTVGNTPVYKSGYLVDGISEIGDTYGYNGINFTESDTEALWEYIGDTKYYYTKIDGTKFYYYDDDGNNVPSDGDYIFYINSSAEMSVQVTYSGNESLFNLYYKAIMENIDGYTYYKDAFEFKKFIEDNGLDEITVGDAVTYTFDDDPTTKIFDFDDSSTDSYIQNSNSYFNNHRAQVIREVIETNLATAISSYANYGDGSSYIMPTISETDWDLITNNVCVATFLQGMSIGGKVYNGYSVVANNLTKEYVDEDDIYILATDSTGNTIYTRANDNNLLSSSTLSIVSNSTLEYYPGVLKLDFERRLYISNNSTIYYYPKSYLGSYSSIIGSTSVNTITYSDMYRYMASLSNDTLKKAYYLALGRERKQAYNVTNGLEDMDTTNAWYLDTYY